MRYICVSDTSTQFYNQTFPRSAFFSLWHHFGHANQLHTGKIEIGFPYLPEIEESELLLLLMLLLPLKSKTDQLFASTMTKWLKYLRCYFIFALYEALSVCVLISSYSLWKLSVDRFSELKKHMIYF